jgi:hypothetical protein
MKAKLYNILFLLIFCCISCNLDNNVTKAECSITGLLCYGMVSNGWEIHEMTPNTIDEVNVYVIKAFDIDLPKDTMVNVRANGLLYPSRNEVLLPAGTTLYYIEVKSLIFIEK